MESLGLDNVEEAVGHLGIVRRRRLFRLYTKAQKYINLLVDVQGHQMLSLSCFNGDPHPGNCLILNDGRLGLIDFGQTKRITNEERLGVARVVEAVGNGKSDGDVADAMRRLGFRTRFDKDEVLARFAALFFDSDSEGKKLGYATPQIYFSTLNQMDQLIDVPDVASESIITGDMRIHHFWDLTSRFYCFVVFVARSSFIIRGMGTLLGKQIRTAARWKDQARIALREGKMNPGKARDIES